MSSKPFLILQLRPEDEASQNEFEAFLRFGQLKEEEVERIRMEQVGLPDIDLDAYQAVIVGGGPYNVSGDVSKKSVRQQEIESRAGALVREIVARDMPYLGACYGLGLLVSACGGAVSKDHHGEPVGAVDITCTDAGKEDPLLAGLPVPFRAFVGHKEGCDRIPHGAVLLASSPLCPVQMIRMGSRVYATQFHPELDTEGIIIRIHAYKHHGYFDPSEVVTLIAMANAETITAPMEIMRRFVELARATPHQ